EDDRLAVARLSARQVATQLDRPAVRRADPVDLVRPVGRREFPAPEGVVRPGQKSEGEGAEDDEDDDFERAQNSLPLPRRGSHPGPSCPPEEAVSSPSGTRLEAGGFRPEWHAAARPLEAASNPGGTPFRGPRRSLSREEIGGGMGCYPFRRPSHGRGWRP